jgi:plastocyanin
VFHSCSSVAITLETPLLVQMKCAAALLLAGMHAATAAEITLLWTIRAYEDRTATVGDSVTFDFTSGHTVHMHPSGNCENTGAVELGTEGPVTYTFTEGDVGDVFFACEVDSHCDNGQIVKFTVSASSDEATPTISPKPSQASVEPPAPPSDGGSGPSNPAPAPASEGGPSPPSPTAPASASSSKGMGLAHVLLLIGAGLLN